MGKGFNEGDTDKVLTLNKQARTHTSGFKLDKCRFIIRVVSEWNRIKNHIVKANTIESFRIGWINLEMRMKDGIR